MNKFIGRGVGTAGLFGLAVSVMVLALFAGHASGDPGADVIVNNPALDTPENTTQNETTLAVRGSTVCAAYNDSGSPTIVNPGLGFSRSVDSGATWIDKGGIGPLQFTDPVLAVHKASGRFYLAHMAGITVNPLVGPVSAIGVSRSTDDCDSFAGLANASPVASLTSGSGTIAGDFQDKPWIAVDNSGGPRDGYVYVCWAAMKNQFPGPLTGVEIRFSRSTDGGLTFGGFGSDQVISPPTDFFPHGCHIDVGPNGEVYVAWSDRSFAGGGPIRVRRSLDGLGFGAATQVNTLPIRAPGRDRVISCVDGFRPTLNGDVQTLAQAQMAVDTTGGPFNGNIYIVWQNDPSGLVDNSDVYFSRSADGGTTWTPEVQFAGGTETDQFEPFVEVGGTGTVSIAWYDRRNDPINNFNFDVYKTFSRDGGVTLDPLVRVSDVSFPVPPILGQATATGNFDPKARGCYMGEYIAVAADASSFYYAWGDNRNMVFSAAYPTGRADPDVFFDRQPAPPVVTPTPIPTPSPTPSPTPTPGGPTCAVFSGFQPPVDNPPTVNVGKAGRTYPVKWQCFNTGGNFVSDLSVVFAIGSQEVACGEFQYDESDALEVSTSGESVLRYDGEANQFVFNWQTPTSGATKCYVFVLRLNDGSLTLTANFMLKP